jgi:membrane protein involved in colicin uptake
MLPKEAFYKKMYVKYIMANKKTVRKNKSKRKSRRRGGGDNSLLNKTRTITIDPTEARRQAEQRRLEEEALRREAAQRRLEEQTRQIQETQQNKSKVVSLIKTRAETKRILAEAKSLASVKKQTDEEANARKESLSSLFSAYGQ